MKKVKLFHAFQATAIESQINDWFEANPQIEIVDSNFSMVKEGMGREFTYYLMYTEKEYMPDLPISAGN